MGYGCISTEEKGDNTSLEEEEGDEEWRVAPTNDRERQKEEKRVGKTSRQTVKDRVL